ncbi:MAG: hypothetical protein CM15mV4_1850 [Caudoviricetes sp.]|nr:MAG: hypothetical protein CM15mV4_1850 [Caudoviricetes sp.]
MVDFNIYAHFQLDSMKHSVDLKLLAGAGTNYPPYNVVNGRDGRTTLEIALAGFSSEDIGVATERNVLTVTAKKRKKKNYAHQGISNRSFSKNWQLGSDVVVENVTYTDGLLTVDLVKELPDKEKRKVWYGEAA